MRRRASNVYERPSFLAKVGGVVFTLTLLAFVLIARSAPHAEAQGGRRSTSADTTALIAAEARAAARLRDAESALARARAQRRTLARARDAITPGAVAHRDSLLAASAELTRLLERSDDAPLVASFRALGTAAPMSGDPRVKQLLDSLNDLDKARADFSSSDGVDPIFVALTARVGSVGHELEALARARRAAMRREIESLAPPPPAASIIDTIPLEAVRDSAARAQAMVAQQLVTARIADSTVRANTDDTAGIFGVGLATLVLAALVVAAVVALAAALTLELRWPRVADAAEAESLSGARVLVTIGAKVEEPDRHRRSSDREIPPAIEQSSDPFRLLYGQVADATFDLTTIAVTGEHPYVTATVAANLAAIAARSGRPTLLLDTDFREQAVAKMMGVPSVAWHCRRARAQTWLGRRDHECAREQRAFDRCAAEWRTRRNVAGGHGGVFGRGRAAEPEVRDRGAERVDAGAGDDDGGGRRGWRGGDLFAERAKHARVAPGYARVPGGERCENARDRAVGSCGSGAARAGVGEEGGGIDELMCCARH